MDCVESHKQGIAVKDEGGVDCIVISEELRTEKKITIPRIGATDIHSDWMPIASSFHLPSIALIHLLQV